MLTAWFLFFVTIRAVKNAKESPYQIISHFMEGQNSANVIYEMPLLSDYQVIMTFQKANK